MPIWLGEDLWMISYQIDFKGRIRCDINIGVQLRILLTAAGQYRSTAFSPNELGPAPSTVPSAIRPWIIHC